MHSKRGGFAAFRTGTERVLSDSGHGINHRVAELEKLVLLFANERAELALVVIPAQQRRLRALARFLGRNFTARSFGGFLSGENFFLFCGAHKFKRRSPRRPPEKTEA